MEQRVLGIDVAKDTLDVALSDGFHLCHDQFSNTQKGHEELERWLRKQPARDIHVCLEATGQYGDGVSVMDP